MHGFPPPFSGATTIRQEDPQGTSFRFTLGLTLPRFADDFVRLPSGIRLREAKIEVLEIGPLHNFLEKGCKWT